MVFGFSLSPDNKIQGLGSLEARNLRMSQKIWKTPTGRYSTSSPLNLAGEAVLADSVEESALLYRLNAIPMMM